MHDETVKGPFKEAGVKKTDDEAQRLLKQQPEREQRHDPLSCEKC
jgi:hypothetical protein